MRKGWKHVTLGDLIHIKHGYGFKGEFFVDEPSEYVLVTPGNFAIGGGFKNNKLKYYDGELKEDFILKGGDVIVTMTDLSKQADTLGFSAKVPNDDNIYLHNQRIGLVSILSEDVVLDFIYWLLRTEAYQKYIAASSTGATVKHTSPNKIYSTKLIIPSCKRVQQKIANILSAYDDLIENNTKRIELLEEQAQLIYEEWFVRMNFPNHKNTKIDAETDLPEGWYEISFRDFTKIKKGKNITKKTIEEGTIPVIAGGLSPAYYHKYSNTISPVVTVSASGANAGFTKIHLEDVWASDCSYIDSSMTEFIFFTYCLMNHRKLEIFNLQKGTAQPHVYPKDIAQIKIIVPNEELLILFEDVVKDLYTFIGNLIEQNKRLKEARDILLPRLMMGIIEV
ncbi:restriction endonuclease subunit S [Psychrobacter celer]|uniref:restriction endonuclease subunit S n=1 Tax=Psychrobacter celer TaxID=306572 RepID=UPI003FD5C810